MRCVTSFSEEGYKEYGQRFLETYLEYVGKPLDVYVETDDYSGYIQHELITYRNLFEVEGCKEYLTMASFPAAQGQIWGQSYNYNFATFKFARKSFAQIDSASRNPDKLYWLDSDIEFSAPFELPEFDVFMCYLGRPEWHSCASLVGWDLNHEMAQEFFKRYWLIHVTGTVFCLERRS